MGAVYRAEQLSLEREVALKLRLPGNQDFPKFVERFLNEAKSAAKIAHPNVVTMFDVGRTQSLVYMAMELLGGGDVDMAVEREGRLPEQQALRWTCDALMGLGAIHSHGIIHRDIKTSNLFLTSDGMVKIGDLGIARDPERDLKITKTNAVLGTPAFMPPEQSVPGGKLDNRSDIYSIGVTLYHMLSGYLPFDDVNPLVILRKIITEPVPSVRTVAPGVRGETAAFIQWLMDKDPDRRPPDVQAALNAVEGLIT
jgi:serine/threonine-protein kinase